MHSATKPLLAIIVFFANGSLAFAQAGSPGGTISKRDKSVSGGDDAAISRRTVPAKTTAPAGGPCGRIVGTWLWYNNAEGVE